MVGELSQNEGFVLICLGGGWGKICGGGIDAAVVVCRQLGFSIDSESYLVLQFYIMRLLFPSITDLILFSSGRNNLLYGFGLPILIRDIQCPANETHLSQCMFAIAGARKFDCSSPFGVKCELTGKSKHQRLKLPQPLVIILIYLY